MRDDLATLGNSSAEIMIPGVNLRNQGETSGTVPFNCRIKKGKTRERLETGFNYISRVIVAIISTEISSIRRKYGIWRYCSVVLCVRAKAI